MFLSPYHRLTQRFISLVLVLVCIISFFSLPVYADSLTCPYCGGVVKSEVTNVTTFTVSIRYECENYPDSCEYFYAETTIKNTGIVTDISDWPGSSGQFPDEDGNTVISVPADDVKSASGYTRDNTPAVSADGQLHLYASVYGYTHNARTGFFTAANAPDLTSTKFLLGSDVSGESSPNNGGSAVCRFVAPADGVYSITHAQSVCVINKPTVSITYSSYHTAGSSSLTLSKGDVAYYYWGFYWWSSPWNCPYDYTGLGVDIVYTPIDADSNVVVPIGNISITNENGTYTTIESTDNSKIYFDSVNNNYYYYNEAGDCTVYYTDNSTGDITSSVTYDSTTNIYNITVYSTSEPTATPEPTATAAPSGGDDSDDSDDDGDDGNWFTDLIGDLLSGILDLLKSLLSAILNFLWGIVKSIFSIFLWLLQQVSTLIPFLPAPAVLALGAGVVAVLVFALIRFIIGFFL